MVDFSVAGPIIGSLAGIDVLLHIYLDLKKAKVSGKTRFREPSVAIPSLAMVMVSVSTLMSFFLVLLFPLAWVFDIEFLELQFLIPLFILPGSIWILGLILMLVGIFLHGWSRYVRQEMAASWAMREEHRLVTTGPYSRIRHPSYTSYFLCFIGLCLLLPTLVTIVVLVGIWGYYIVARSEEEHLLHHFGGAYREYMKRTERFVPKMRLT